MNKERDTLIDLGLSELVRALENQQHTEEAVDSNLLEEVPASFVNSTNKINEIRSPFGILADEGLWQKINELAEKRMNNSGKEGVEATLWWIKASLSLGTMPASILAAPLDSTARRMLALDEEVRLELLPIARQVAEDISISLNGSADNTIRESLDSLIIDLGGKEEKIAPAISLLPEWEDTVVDQRQYEKEQRQIKPKRKFLSVVALLTLCATGWFFWNENQNSQSEHYAARMNPELLLLQKENVPDQQLTLPVLNLKQSASQLDAVLYEMGPSAEPKDTKRVSTIKEQIDTSGPLEDQIPKSEQATDLKQQVSKESEKLFEAIADTEVHQAPNFRSEVVALLRSGDVVSVDRELGDWVRLRSQQGKPGYVLSSDLRRK